MFLFLPFKLSTLCRQLDTPGQGLGCLVCCRSYLTMLEGSHAVVT